jgi:phospholipid transport system substrate-binding protein
MRKKSLSLFVLAALCTVAAVPAAKATPATEAFIQENFDKGTTILNSKTLSEAERRDQFRSLLLELAATRRIALFTLGPYAARATAADVDTFVEAFKNYSVSLYEKGLNKYEGQLVKVTGSSDRAADDSVVWADILSPNRTNEPLISVAFRVRPNDMGTPTVTDILFGGISLATVQRAEFTAFLSQHNGSILELINRLNGMR